MNLGIIGYGKMGAEIEKISIQKGYSIKFKINSKNTHELTSNALSKVDVVFEFSNPNTAFNNVLLCLQNKKPIVCGTTGWMKNLPKAMGEGCPYGIDVYFDNTGGPIHDAVMENLNLGARVVICGVVSLADKIGKPDIGPRYLRQILGNRARVQGFLVFD